MSDLSEWAVSKWANSYPWLLQKKGGKAVKSCQKHMNQIITESLTLLFFKEIESDLLILKSDFKWKSKERNNELPTLPRAIQLYFYLLIKVQKIHFVTQLASMAKNRIKIL